MYIMESESKGAAAIVIMDYEFLAILEALRRDLRNERLASFEAEHLVDRQRHDYNAHRSVHLLEVLNPKHPSALMPKSLANDVNFVLLSSAGASPTPPFSISV